MVIIQTFLFWLINRILNAIKCAICHEIIDSPVILPSTDTICKKHVSNKTRLGPLINYFFVILLYDILT